MRDAAAIFLTLIAPAVTSGEFVLPDVPDGAATEFAWWDVFTDPFTDFRLPPEGNTVPPFPDDEGNTPNRPESDNSDAILIQNGPEAGTFITSTNGIYSFSGLPTEFLILDQPAIGTDSVLLQSRSLGTLPALESAFLFYRDSEDGVLKAAGGPSGFGFLRDEAATFAMWEWDLSSVEVHDFFVGFVASGSSMSLQEVQLDTFDQPTDNLGVALQLETNSVFSTVGGIEHNRVGESSPRPTYRPDDQVELRPVVQPGFDFEFVGWEGDLTGTSVPETLTINGSPRVRAVFAPKNYEAWTFNQINPFVTDPSFSERADREDNPDGDAFENLLEYALGGRPEVRDAAGIRPRLQVSAESGPTFVYRRQLAAEDLEYRVLVSDDLANWHHNGDGSGKLYTRDLPDPLFNGDGTETVKVRPTDALSADGPVFMRLEVLYDPQS